MNKQEFGNKISELRRLKNISQTEFAEMLDISVSALSKIERGVNSPRVITAEAMAEHLDIPISRLLSSKPAENKQEYIDEIIEQISVMDDYDIESIILLNKGKGMVTLKDIQVWLGHSDFSTTANTYSHLDSSSKKNSLSAFEGIISLPCAAGTF